MESNFQLVNVPLLSREGEKPDFMCVLDGIRILIHFDTCLTEYFKIENNPIWKLVQIHTGVPG